MKKLSVSITSCQNISFQYNYNAWEKLSVFLLQMYFSSDVYVKSIYNLSSIYTADWHYENWLSAIEKKMEWTFHIGKKMYIINLKIKGA